MQSNDPIHEVERIVLANVLMNERLRPGLLDKAKVESFADLNHATTFQLISKMYLSDKDISLQTAYLEADDQPTRGLLIQLSEDYIPGGAEQAAEQMIEAARTRRIQEGMKEVKSRLASGEYSSDSAIAQLNELARTEIRGTPGSDIVTALDQLKETIAANKVSGLGFETGFGPLDDDFIRYQPGHLWLVGGWTSAGKTTWMITAIWNLFNLYDPEDAPSIAVFSTEMTRDQLLAKLVGAYTGANPKVILSGQYPDNIAARIEGAMEILGRYKLRVFDDLRDVDDIAMQAKTIQQKDGLDLIFIDFIQNCTIQRMQGSSYEKLAEVARVIQSIGLEMKLTSVALSQVSNQTARDDVGLAEYKGAGELAAAADIGALLRKEKTHKDILSFEIRKNRHGKCDKYLMQFINGWTRLKSIPIERHTEQ